MKRKRKRYIKLNIISLVFVAVSFISVTLAWFAYGGLSSAATEVNVKAWYIEMEKDGETVSNSITISLDDIYPGMETVNETVRIKNLGDSDAQVKYSITSARVLDLPEDNYVAGESVTSEYIEDRLSHEYPFKINMNLSKSYILSKTDSSLFKVSISWPLDSGNDQLDSDWGMSAYEFKNTEEQSYQLNNNYQKRPAIKVLISLTAEQYIESETASDVNYNLGDEILFDVSTNSKCTTVGSTCLRTTVIDVDNKKRDNVTLLPDINTTYLESQFNNYEALSALTKNWHQDAKASTRPLTAKDVLNIISLDIDNSFLVRTNISNTVIGNTKYNSQVMGGANKDISYQTRMDEVIARGILSSGYYIFPNNYSYLLSNGCYWTNSAYDNDKVYAIDKENNSTLKLYGETKTGICKIVPVIVADKSRL